MSNDPYDYGREEEERRSGTSFFKGLIIAILASLVFWAALGIFIRANAEAADSYTYTRNHCISFATAVTNERWAAGVQQVRYLSRSITLNSVERYADAWLRTAQNRYLNGLVNSCYNVVF